ncbi:MAG: UDP-N-acetylglucosamine--N-acetylmuramyl-(pentapeptide) pyrophosphoryl-undecaprenol N-acetylglucosamine transferase [Deferribacterales bacterium]
MRVIIAGGGTGGHLYPGIAIAEKFRNSSIDNLFIVSNRGIERKILNSLGFKFVEQKEAPLKSVNLIRKIKSIFNLISNVASTMKIIRKGDIVLLLGGFASFSAGLIALIKRNKLYIHEQNSVMGLSNRFFSKFAEKVFLSFETNIDDKKYIMVGNPVRQIFKNAIIKEKPDKHILIIGGSQGSRFLNNLIIPISSKLLGNGYTIIHQTGEKLYDEVLEYYKKSGISSNNLTVRQYIEDIFETMQWADLIISRAGAGAIYEILYSKRFGIFIPFAGATDNHQEHNAQLPVKKGVGICIKEKDATPEMLYTEIEKYYNNFESYKERLSKIEFIDSAALIIREMELGNV